MHTCALSATHKRSMSLVCHFLILYYYYLSMFDATNAKHRIDHFAWEETIVGHKTRAYVVVKTCVCDARLTLLWFMLVHTIIVPCSGELPYSSMRGALCVVCCRQITIDSVTDAIFSFFLSLRRSSAENCRATRIRINRRINYALKTRWRSISTVCMWIYILIVLPHIAYIFRIVWDFYAFT